MPRVFIIQNQYEKTQSIYHWHVIFMNIFSLLLLLLMLLLFCLLELDTCVTNIINVFFMNQISWNSLRSKRKKWQNKQTKINENIYETIQIKVFLVCFQFSLVGLIMEEFDCVEVLIPARLLYCIFTNGYANLSLTNFIWFGFCERRHWCVKLNPPCKKWFI